MTAQIDFVDSVLSEARRASAATGVLVSVILAEWGNETGWGTSPAWLGGHNPAGISPGGRLGSYVDIDAGVDAWIVTISQGIYAPIRTANGYVAQCQAFGASPWAGSHYIGDTPFNYPGGALIANIITYGLTAYDESSPSPTTNDLEVIMTLAADDQDAFNTFVRESWYALRTDPLTPETQPVLWFCFHQPGNGAPGTGFGGRLDYVLAWIHDTAGANLRA